MQNPNSLTAKSLQPYIHTPLTIGPVTKRLQSRTTAIYIVMLILGALPYLFHLSGSWKAFGLGLWLPGGGFLAVGGWAILVTFGVLLLFVLSLIAWFGAGMNTAPVLVWLGSAAIAGWVAGESTWNAAPYVAGGLLLLAFVGGKSSQKKGNAQKLKNRELRNAYLPEEIAAIHEMEARPAADSEGELTLEELQNYRYIFDRALQPIDQFNGFDIIDQFQTSAIRYQINCAGYALGILQAQYTPNFHGYLNLAQQQLTEKYLQKKVWRYWIYENAWGNLSLNGDPVGKDNIMLTGWFNIQLLMYAANTGDLRYAQKGALPFKRNSKTTYYHDIHTINDSLVWNYKQQLDKLCLFPCEPNWVYSSCNFYCLNAILMYDKVFGTHNFDEIAVAFREKLDTEFTTIDGGITALRSQLTGIPVPFPVPNATVALMVSGVLPELAQRSWAISRHEEISYDNGQPKVKITGKEIDLANYTKGSGVTLSGVLGIANEMGDYEIAKAAARQTDELYRRTEKDGALFYKKASNSANINIAMGRILRRGYWRNTITQMPSENVLKGPLLNQATYPDVLVAKAISSDGKSLELVLYPGNEKAAANLNTIGLSRLQPNKKYLLDINKERTSFLSDNLGEAALEIKLNGRTPLLVTTE